MRMRTIPKAAELLRKEDPETPLSEKMLRRMIKKGYIAPVYVGHLTYIDVDRVPEFMAAAAAAPPAEAGTMRPIAE